MNIIFFKAETTGVVIETCVKYPGGPIRIRGTDMVVAYRALRYVSPPVFYVY